MSPRQAARRAGVVWSLCMLLLTVVIILDPPASGEAIEYVLAVAFAVVFATIGAVVSARVHGNPIGWLLLGLGTYWIASAAVGPLLRAPGVEVLDTIDTWQGHWTWAPGVVIPIAVLPLLFPDGHLPSRRWRPVLVAAAVGTLAFTVQMAFGPDLGGSPAYGPNPYHQPVIDNIAGPLSLLMLVAILAAPVSLLVRYRRAAGEERSQLKWLAYGVLVAVLASLAISTLGFLEALGIPGIGLPDAVANGVILLGVMAIPSSMGVAVLRYRLYDIDRLISRTLSYTLTISVLATAYAAIVIGAPRLLPVSLDSPITVATATLAAAATFRPLARRVQARVDRRFNRTRYDAQRTIDTFAQRLRQELDLDTLGTGLCTVAADTMQPTHVSLWLAGPGPTTPDGGLTRTG